MRWVILFTLAAAVGAVAGIDIAVMVCDAQADWSEAMAYFAGEPRFDSVSFYDCRYSTPSPQEFSKHDVVIAGGSLLYGDRELFGDRLADYVDQGGGVMVESGGIIYDLYRGEGIGGRWHSDGYSPYPCDDFEYDVGFLDLTIDEPGHGIFEGAVGMWDVYRRAYVYSYQLRPEAVELAHYEMYQQSNLGGVAINAAQTVVAANFQAHDDHWWTGDGYLIMANAACWLAAHSEVREMSWGEIKAQFE